ncbi:MAG: Smr/MutS family protein [Bacteroides sp.]|nr:MAG: Smr/MutS family protein [Bacteroides sp.]
MRKKLLIGDKIILKNNIEGFIISLNKKNIIVQYNNVKIIVKYNAIINCYPSNYKQLKHYSTKAIFFNKNYKNYIDLHQCLGKEDAINKILNYIDMAVVNDIKHISIIHGIGNGTMQSIVHKYLKKSKFIKKFKINPINGGITNAILF